MYFIYLLLSATLVLAKHEDYKEYRVYNVKFETEEHQNSFHLLQSDNVDYWRKPTWKHGVVGRAMVPPSHFDWFEETLEELHIDKDVFIEDVYEYLNKKETVLEKTRANDVQEFGFDRYYRYNDILNHLRQLNETYSNSTTISLELVEFGQTEENRPLVYLKISRRDNITTEDRPVVVLEGAINPRDWITVPSALNAVNRVLEDESRLLDFDWIIIPVLNPDGYEYTHTNLRLWTKSKSTQSNLGFICPGVNLNRNFDIDWLNFDSSSSPCSHLYAGVSVFSEIETQLIRSILEEYSTRIRLYISLQNNSGFISYPWSFERAASGMFRQHHLVGLEMVKAIGNYSLDIGALATDRVSGTSTDYVREIGVFYTYNIDIEQTEEGPIIPEEDIVDVAEDVWRAIEAAVNNI